MLLLLLLLLLLPPPPPLLPLLPLAPLDGLRLVLPPPVADRDRLTEELLLLLLLLLMRLLLDEPECGGILNWDKRPVVFCRPLWTLRSPATTDDPSSREEAVTTRFLVTYVLLIFKLLEESSF